MTYGGTETGREDIEVDIVDMLSLKDDMYGTENVSATFTTYPRIYLNQTNFV